MTQARARRELTTLANQILPDSVFKILIVNTLLNYNDNRLIKPSTFFMTIRKTLEKLSHVFVKKQF